jgi:Spy/CpxP family protein refolding chaperone
MRNKILIGAGALTLALVAGAAYAAMGHHGHGIKMMENMISNRIEDAADFVEATPQQREVIESAKQEVFKALEARAADRQAHATEVLKLLNQDRIDVDRLNALVDQKADDMRAVGHLIVAQVIKVHDVLTPQQRQKLLEHIKKRHARALQMQNE